MLNSCLSKKMTYITKKMENNLQESKKSCIFAPEIVTPWNYKVVYEETSDVDIEALKPHEAMSIREMLIRTDRGQRLDVKTRMRTDDCPDNMYRMQTDPNTGCPIDPLEERFEHTPPDDINDIVDVQRYQEEIADLRKDLEGRRKKKTVANAPDSAPAEEEEKKKKSPLAKEVEEA